MKITQDRQSIWCEKCQQWKDKYTGIYKPDGDDGRVCCLEENEVGSHLLGYTFDQEYILLFACKYYYFYHKKGQCRCIQNECNCMGYEEKCDNKLGKLCYEQGE